MTSAYRKNQPTNRQLKVSELIRRGMSILFAKSEVYHPILDSVQITILDVKTSVDLKVATIFIYPIRNCPDNELLKILNFLSSEYRKKLNARLKLRYSPEIRFVIDNNIDNRIDREKFLEKLSLCKI